MWVRGLKHTFDLTMMSRAEVAPYVGAWIETTAGAVAWVCILVAPYVGAWIETTIVDSSQMARVVAPYVGAWIETRVGNDGREIVAVAPYVGAWIETQRPCRARDGDVSRTLCGCVD